MKSFQILFVSLLLLITSAGSAWALDCRNPQTQTDMNRCGNSNLDIETSRINKAYNAYRAKLSTEQKQQFKEVQLAWIKFKDLSCKFEVSGAEGGSMYSMALADCLTAKTVQRNKEIELLANCQEGDPSCLVR